MRETQSGYLDKLRFIRKFADGFLAKDGYDAREYKKWSSARKGQITKYYNAITAKLSRTHYLYRPRNKARLKAALRYTGMSEYKKLRVVILSVPVDMLVSGKYRPVKPKITFNKAGDMSVNIRGIDRRVLLFEELGYTPEEFAQQPQEILEDIIEQHPARSYAIVARDFEVGRGIPNFYTRNSVIGTVLKLMADYGKDAFDENDSNSSYYGNWLHGLVAYDFKNVRQQIDYNKSLIKYRKTVEEDKEKRQKLRKKIERLQRAIKETNRRRDIPRALKDKVNKRRLKEIEKAKAEIRKLLAKRLKQ